MLRRALIAAALTALLAPAAAHGATVSKTGTTLRYVASAGERDLVRLYLEGGGTNIRFEKLLGPAPVAVAPCFVSSGVRCPVVAGDRISIDLKDNDDALNFQLLADVPFAMTIDGGPGDDSLRGGPRADVIRGGDGGDGISGAGGADDISGGTGFDRASFFGLGAVRVSLDGVANDGQAGGAEGANVRTDVEDLLGSAFSDTLIGSDAGNALDGDAGNDVVDGRGGIDSYDLGAGNDTVTARDGLGERIVCAAGDDTVTADDIDEFSDCEHTALSGELVRDLDKDGIAKPQDCNDADPAIRPGAPDPPDDGSDQNCDGADATNPDRDGDGVPRPFDCDDANPNAAPGKKERFGNKVDEDCSGRADPLQSITTPVRARFIAAPGGARITRLQVVRPRKGTRVQVRCKGGGCRFAKRSLRVRKGGGTVDLRKRFKLTRLGGSQVLEVRLLREDSIGRVTRFTGRGSAIPATRILCLNPGKKRPGRC